MILSMLLGASCAAPGNRMTATADAPFQLGAVRTSLWWHRPDADGALLILSSAVVACADLPGEGWDAVLEGPTLQLWFSASEAGFEGEYVSGVSATNLAFPEAYTSDLRTFSGAVFVDGATVDLSYEVGQATVEAVDADMVTGVAAGLSFDAVFQAEVCTILPEGVSEPCTDTAETEVCDGVDNDCDGSVDEGLSETWYPDDDGDGHGSPEGSVEDCEALEGWVASDDDCNDAEAAMYPGATEGCDGIDNDCDGTVDEDCE